MHPRVGVPRCGVLEASSLKPGAPFCFHPLFSCFKASQSGKHNSGFKKRDTEADLDLVEA
jgi:hypothetical protein